MNILIVREIYVLGGLLTRRLSRKEAKLLTESALGRKLSDTEIKEILSYYTWVMDGIEEASDLNDSDTGFVTVYRPEEW